MASAKFNNFIRSAKKATKKAANTTMELADIAALNVKLQAGEVKLSEKFEELGRLSYDKLANSADNAEKIAAVVEEIETLLTAANDIKAEIKLKKAMRAKKNRNKDKEPCCASKAENEENE